MKYFLVMVSAVVLAALSAVGVSALDSSPAVAASGNAKKCGGGKIALNPNELKAFKIHNNMRQNRGLSKLCVHPALQKAARAHSRDMINRDYFSHNTKGSNRNPGQRLKGAGYNWRTYGENIGYNSSSKAMMKAWINSPGHRSNILNKSFKEIGIGAVRGNYRGNNTIMFTADFGAR